MPTKTNLRFRTLVAKARQNEAIFNVKIYEKINLGVVELAHQILGY